MQRPAIARRTIAIELLRRLDQIEGDTRRSRPTLPPHARLAHAVQEDEHLTSVTFNRQCRLPSFRTTCTRFLPLNDGFTETTPSRAATPNSPGGSDRTDPAKLVKPDASTGSTKRKLIRTGSINSYSSQGAWTDVWPTDPQTPSIFHMRAKQKVRTGAAGAELTPPATPSTNDTLPVGFDTPGSNVTFADVCRPLSPLSGTWYLGPEQDTTEGARERGIGSPDQIRVDFFERMHTVVDEHHRPRKHRHDSVTPKFNTAKTTPVTLRAQSRSNGGLLELRASATKPKSPNPARTHRCHLSLHLPVRPPSPQPRDVQPDPTPYSTSSAVTPTPSANSTTPSSSSPTRTVTQSELEQQYKYRHIFIGTASLHHFLATLETSSPHTTSKPAVMKAFTLLAANEQVLFRQASSSSEDWHLVTRITPDISTFDCVALARVQLGSISLQRFMELVLFGTYGEVAVERVVEAFKVASYMDAHAAEACLYTQSKAFIELQRDGF